MHKNPVILIGTGEMGGVFARGFLKTGYPVYPINRNDNLQELALTIKDPEMILVAVGEADLQNVLGKIPDTWKDKLTLLQNELLPADWQKHDINPTVISVWFEKKPGMDFKVLVPSPAFGKHAELLKEALSALGIPVEIVASEEQLLFELVRKNVYIVTTNIAGIRSNGTVDELRKNHAQLFNDVAMETLAIQKYLTGKTFNENALLQSVLVAFDGDPLHNCMGRSAPARLARAQQQASNAGISIPVITSIAENDL